MEWIKNIGMAGFLFFLIKGILWLVVFALIYFGWIKKEKIESLKMKLNFRKNKNNQ